MVELTCHLIINCGATLETWTGIGGFTIDDLKVGSNNLESTPNRKERLGSLLEIMPEQGTHFGSRMSGWLLSPITGNFTFWIASDDNGEFWLSTDDHPANKTRICHVTVEGHWNTGIREWNKWSEQKSLQIPLVKNRYYYFEVSVCVI